MPARVLLTAFEPYGEWPTNASWLTLVELTRELPEQPKVTTRLYPVDFDRATEMLSNDLKENYDLALHLGQAPGATCLALEAIGLNVAVTPGETAYPTRRLQTHGPIAYESNLPLHDWAERLRQAGVPAVVSYHAGHYLCNAVLYSSLHFAQSRGLKTQATFLHLPLDPSQVLLTPKTASMPVTRSADAIRLLLMQFVDDLTGVRS